MSYISVPRKAVIWSMVLCFLFLSLFSGVSAQAQTGNTAVENFVKRLYNVALHREAEPGGLNHWTQGLIGGKYTAAQVVNFMLLEAPEFLNRNISDQQFIEISYMTFFNRQADPGGRDFWLKRLSQGYTRKWVMANMLGAPTAEFHQLCQAAGIATGKIGTKAADLPNQRGNTPGNINNLGIVAVQGDWIYFADFNLRLSSGSLDSGHLYRVRTNGRDLEKLNNLETSYINVVGERIYYSVLTGAPSGIYKMTLDGQDNIWLLSGTLTDISVIGDWIYFIDVLHNGSAVYKMKTDGTGRVKLTNDEVSYFQVVGSHIYYTSISKNGNIYRMNLDGTNVRMINQDDSQFINVVGDWIYYSNSSDGRKLYRIKVDGTGRKRLNSHESLFINVVGDWIYYDHDDYPHRIKMDGTGLQRIGNHNILMYVFNVVRDWMYFIDVNLDGISLKRMRVNGTELTNIQS